MVVDTPEIEAFGDLVQVRAKGAFGTGLLVGPGLVLTALHCVCDPNRDWAVRSRVGIYLLRELQKGEERHHNARIVWPRIGAVTPWPSFSTQTPPALSERSA
jgi:hypothetical protein